MKNSTRRIVSALAVLGLIATQSAHAATPASLADLIAGISFLDVIAAIFSIGGLVIAVDLSQLGYMKVRRMVKGAH